MLHKYLQEERVGGAWQYPHIRSSYCATVPKKCHIIIRTWAFWDKRGECGIRIRCIQRPVLLDNPDAVSLSSSANYSAGTAASSFSPQAALKASAAVPRSHTYQHAGQFPATIDFHAASTNGIEIIGTRVIPDDTNNDNCSNTHVVGNCNNHGNTSTAAAANLR
mmetsp:Transcript_39865/g.65262  ORF Transcript_39865/g.65262 Transcript_39865/m.65262 type:complete len:164 (+) Transcript_39865:113-604(+)